MPLLRKHIFCVSLHLLFELFGLRFLLWTLNRLFGLDLAALVEIIVIKAVQGHEFAAALGVVLAHEIQRLATMLLSDLANMLLLDGTAQKSANDLKCSLVIFARIRVVFAFNWWCRWLKPVANL